MTSSPLILHGYVSEQSVSLVNQLWPSGNCSQVTLAHAAGVRHRQGERQYSRACLPGAGPHRKGSPSQPAGVTCRGHLQGSAPLTPQQPAGVAPTHLAYRKTCLPTGRPKRCCGDCSAKRKRRTLWLSASFSTSVKGMRLRGSSATGSTAAADAAAAGAATAAGGAAAAPLAGAAAGMTPSGARSPA